MTINWLTVSDVCERYSISRPTLWRYRKKPDFPKARRLGAKAIRFSISEMDHYFNQLPTA